MVTNRKKIGLVFISDDIGVVYYLINIISTLDFLPESQKPEIVVFFNQQCEKFLHLIKYNYKKEIRVDITSRKKIKLYIKSFFQRKNLFYQELIKSYNVDGIFPFNDFPVSIFDKTIVTSWIPDFQHKFYPQFFSTKNLLLRESRFKSIIKRTNVLVLSSNNALMHFKQFYRKPADLSVKVLQFISMIRDYPVTPFVEIKERYGLTLPFFLVSNQFYEHKNHIAVLKAIKLLKDEGFQFQVIFTGKTEDYRNPQFYPSLLAYIKSYGIESHLQILGLIPREDQLSILVNSLSVIQPSKFEGWSTIIEDAKTLRQQIICSLIPVHIEQLGDIGFYFDANSHEQLAEQMRNFIKGNNVKKILPDDYEQRVRHFAESFIEIFNVK
jgi:glycosyltransferase involved in cell wall biosynthesis